MSNEAAKVFIDKLFDSIDKDSSGLIGKFSTMKSGIVSENVRKL